MSKTTETPAEISADDLHAINESFKEELRYFNNETMMRDAVWLFDSLIKEGKITAETEIGEVINILNQEQGEYSKNLGLSNYAHDDNRWNVNVSQADKVTDAFDKMTEEESGRLKKVIQYHDDTLSVLSRLKDEGAIKDDSPLKEAHALLKVRLARPESRMSEEEDKKREVEKEPYEK